MASRMTGAPNLRRRLRSMPDHVTKELREALDDGIKAVQVGAAERVPRDTGNLSFWLLAKQALGKKDKGLRVEFGLRTKKLRKHFAFYGPFLEWGREGGLSRTRKRKVAPMRARPFLAPALEYAKPFIKKRVRKGLRSAIDRAMSITKLGN